MAKIILLWKTFKLLPKGYWLTVFTFGTVGVSNNDHWFTKCGI